MFHIVYYGKFVLNDYKDFEIDKFTIEFKGFMIFIVKQSGPQYFPEIFKALDFNKAERLGEE